VTQGLKDLLVIQGQLAIKVLMEILVIPQDLLGLLVVLVLKVILD
jgi:hypothetical protein